MKFVLTACFLVLIGNGAFAGETCEVARKVDGRMVYQAVPCASLETPVPCFNASRDSLGRTVGEARPCRPGEQKTVEQLERERSGAQKKACGADFGKLRIGMTLDRFEQCTEALSFVAETVMKGRVVETYRSTFYLVHASDGVILAFTKRTN